MEPSTRKVDFNLHTPADTTLPAQIRSDLAGNRVGQNQLLPNSVDGQVVGNIIESSHAGLGTGARGTVVIPDGSSGTFTFTLFDKLSRTILAVPDVSWYIGSVSTATQWPNTTFGMGNMRSTVWNDFGTTDNVNVVTKLIVRNDTGSPQTVIGICRWRVIKNSTAEFQQGQVSTS